MLFSKKKIKEQFQDILTKYPKFIPFLQVTVLYAYSIITLTYTVINSLGFFPDFLNSLFPVKKSLLSISLFKMLATPEKTFLVYFIAVELILKGKKTPLVVKYHFVLAFILEMIVNAIISAWDLLSHRDFDTLTGEIDFSEKSANAFFTVFHPFTCALYLYCYFKAITGKFIIFPKPFDKISDSAAYWLNIKIKSKSLKKSEKDKESIFD